MALSIAARHELEELHRKNKDNFSPRTIVNFARDKKTALHDYFEWTDSKAAERYRILQAAQVQRLYVIVRQEDKPPIRGFVSLIQDRDFKAKKIGNGIRRHIDDVMDDEGLKANYIETVLMELRAFKRKYEQIQELSEVWDAINRVDERLRPSAAGASEPMQVTA
jgi:hypothetical protein